MGLLDWLNRRVERVVRTEMRMIGGAPVYPDSNSSTFITDGYDASAAIYTIVSHSAKKFSNVPRQVYKPSTEKRQNLNRIVKKSLGQEIENSELKELLKRPNPYMGGDQFWESVYTSYDLQGEAFIWLNRGNTDADNEQASKIKPLELFWLPPHLVELIPDPEDVWGVLGYTLNLNGATVELRKSDIIHWRKFNPNFDAITREHLRGFSPLKAGMKLLTADGAAQDAQVAMHQNDGAKGVLFEKSLRTLTTDQADTIKSVINKRINNRDLKGSVASLQGDWGYINFGLSAVDMQLLQAMDVSFSRLCNLFRVSPNLFIAGQTRDNLREARKELITGKIIPDATSLDDELNRILSICFPGQTIASDFSELPEMQYEMDFINTIYKDMFLNGAVNIDEWRAAMGHDATGLPEHTKYFFSGQMTPIDEAGLPSLNDGFGNDNAGSL